MVTKQYDAWGGESSVVYECRNLDGLRATIRVDGSFAAARKLARARWNEANAARKGKVRRPRDGAGVVPRRRGRCKCKDANAFGEVGQWRSRRICARFIDNGYRGWCAACAHERACHAQ